MLEHLHFYDLETLPQCVACFGAALSETSAVGSQDLSGQGERQDWGPHWGRRQILCCVLAKCVRWTFVMETASSLLPFLSLSPKPKDCTGSPRRCASKDRRGSLEFCTGMAKWWDHITNFTLPFGLLSLRIYVLTCNTPVTVHVT